MSDISNVEFAGTGVDYGRSKRSWSAYDAGRPDADKVRSFLKDYQSKMVNGEYSQSDIDEMIESKLATVIDNADGLAKAKALVLLGSDGLEPVEGESDIRDRDRLEGDYVERIDLLADIMVKVNETINTRFDNEPGSLGLGDLYQQLEGVAFSPNVIGQRDLIVGLKNRVRLGLIRYLEDRQYINDIRNGISSGETTREEVFKEWFPDQVWNDDTEITFEPDGVVVLVHDDDWRGRGSGLHAGFAALPTEIPVVLVKKGTRDNPAQIEHVRPTIYHELHHLRYRRYRSDLFDIDIGQNDVNHDFFFSLEELKEARFNRLLDEKVAYFISDRYSLIERDEYISGFGDFIQTADLGEHTYSQGYFQYRSRVRAVYKSVMESERQLSWVVENLLHNPGSSEEKNLALTMLVDRKKMKYMANFFGFRRKEFDDRYLMYQGRLTDRFNNLVHEVLVRKSNQDNGGFSEDVGHHMIRTIDEVKAFHPRWCFASLVSLLGAHELPIDNQWRDWFDKTTLLALENIMDYSGEVISEKDRLKLRNAMEKHIGKAERGAGSLRVLKRMLVRLDGIDAVGREDWIVSDGGETEVDLADSVYHRLDAKLEPADQLAVDFLYLMEQENEPGKSLEPYRERPVKAVADLTRWIDQRMTVEMKVCPRWKRMQMEKMLMQNTCQLLARVSEDFVERIMRNNVYNFCFEYREESQEMVIGMSNEREDHRLILTRSRKRGEFMELRNLAE